MGLVVNPRSLLERHGVNARRARACWPLSVILTVRAESVRERLAVGTGGEDDRRLGHRQPALGATSFSSLSVNSKHGSMSRCIVCSLARIGTKIALFGFASAPDRISRSRPSATLIKSEAHDA